MFDEYFRALIRLLKIFMVYESLVAVIFDKTRNTLVRALENNA